MMDWWTVLEKAHATIHSGDLTPDWNQALALLSEVPGLEGVCRVVRDDYGHLQVAEQAGSIASAAEALVTLVSCDMEQTPLEPIRWPSGPNAVVIPIVGHRAHYGWLVFVVDNTMAAMTPHAMIVSRHVGALLGLWADTLTAPDPDRVLRLQALYRTVIGSNDLILRAKDEEDMVQHTAERLITSGLFSGVAVRSGRKRILTMGLVEVASEVSTMTAPVMRNGQQWGVLVATTDANVDIDADTRELVRWSAELLGHGLDEWDLKQRLQEGEARQRYRATHDALTDLENRVAFLDTLPEAVERVRVDGTLLVVGMLDLDNFKPINDTYGHNAGDRLLRDWARRLASWFDNPHRVARLGGDEFAFRLAGFRDITQIETFIGDMMEQLMMPMPLELPGGLTVDVQIEASVGLTVAPLDDAEPDVLLRHADMALYHVKEQRVKRQQPWAWYQAPPTRQSVYEPHIPDGVRVHYQPIVDLRSGHVHSLEALVRLWDGHTLLAPGQFISELTPSELERLTFAVLDQVLQDMRVIDDAWHTASPLSISVNLEPSMLSPDCIRHIGDQVTRAAVSPERIALELLETSDFLSQAVARHQLQVLKERRFEIALDDVGSSYSSLLRIKELPIDTLKLDQTFVRSIPQAPEDLLFVISMQTLARGFHAHFVAEGVENEDILDALQVLGVDRIQGYVFTKPLPLTELLAWGRRYQPRPSDGQPHTLLGAYAAHIAYQSVARLLPNAPETRLRIAGCPLTRFLETTGLALSALAQEHAIYHEKWRPEEDGRPEGDRLKSLLLTALGSPTPGGLVVNHP